MRYVSRFRGGGSLGSGGRGRFGGVVDFFGLGGGAVFFWMLA